MRNLRFKTIFAFSLGLLALTGIAPIYGSDWIFTGFMPGGHRGKVTAIAHKGNTILSAGEDGFLEIWDTRGAQERFQVSLYRIIAMTEKPGTDEVCLLENDGMGLYRITAWNYKERKNIFSQVLNDPIDSVFYSMGGNFIIAARTGRTGLVFFDSASGKVIPSPQSLAGAGGISLAATGKSERNMVAYFTSGRLSYWDLESGNETNHFTVPANLHPPVLFGNNRYLAGVNEEGLAVINAVSGELLARDNAVPNGSLLCPSGDELICLVQKESPTANGGAEVYRYTIDRSGRLNRAGNFSLTVSGNGNKRFTAIAAGANGSARGATIAMGTDDGSLVLANMNGQPRTLTVKEQVHITETEVSGSTIAFLTDNGTIGFIPRNYSQLTARKAIHVESNQENYTRITAFSDSDEQFVFWQDKDIRTLPIIRSPGPGSKKLVDGITLRSPISAADSFGGKILFLDSTGNISVVSPLNGKKAFTFFSVGLMDAAFIDNNRIIIGRSAVAGNTPFLIININTGETVPLPYPAQAGVIIHRGTRSIFAATVSPDHDTGEIRTSILQLNLANITHSARFVDFRGEDTSFSLVEVPTGEDSVDVAATIGGESAAIYSDGGLYYQELDRSGGLPLKLIDGSSAIISLDRDGSICWHDRSGKLLAVFRLHPYEWTLQTERGTINGGISR